MRNNEKNYLYINFFVILLIFLFICVWGYNVYNLCNSSYPTEYRDWATMYLSELFSHNTNPYLPKSGPPFYYLYGFLFSMIIGKILLINSENIVLVHKVAVLFCVLLAAFIIFFETKRISKSSFLGFIAFGLMLWASSNTNPHFIIRPDSMGVVFFVAALVSVSSKQNVLNIFSSAAFVVLSFYCKQYFLFAVVPIFIFLTTLNRRKALIFIISFGVFFLSSIVLVYNAFPMYFYCTLVGQSRVVGGPTSHLLMQLKFFCVYYWPLLVLSIAYISFVFIQKTFRCEAFSKLFLTELCAPSCDLYFITFVVSLLCLIPLGKNTGAFLSYFYQMALPPLCVYGLFVLSQVRSKKLVLFFIVGIAVSSICHNGRSVITKLHYQQGQDSWELASNIIANTPGEKVLAPIFNGLSNDPRDKLFDTGNSEYFYSINPHGEKSDVAKFFDFIFPERRLYFEQYVAYYSGIEHDIIDKKISLIVLVKGYHTFVSDDVLFENYSSSAELVFFTGDQSWTCIFYTPK